jgi:hypothetical protein
MAVGGIFRPNQTCEVIYCIYKHDTTLKMAFGAIVFANFDTGPPNNDWPIGVLIL